MSLDNLDSDKQTVSLKPSPRVQIESLDNEGRGVAHVDGKVLFIEGALPGEEITYSVYRKKPHFELARIESILKSSAYRVTPKCQYFKICGGCALQHLDHQAQVAAKQRVLEEGLMHIGKVKAERILPPIYGIPWHYRQRARLSMKYVRKKGKLLIGFHERKSSFVADMDNCEILPKVISDMLEPMKTMMEKLSVRERIPQIELAMGKNVTVLVLRIMESLPETDAQLLREFADQYGIQFWLQPKGPDTAYPFYPEKMPALDYHLPDFGLVMPFYPTEFTQVNPMINRVLVKTAIDLLDPIPKESVVDLFCGLGNFSLAIASRGAKVLGVEGSQGLVKRAKENAGYNGLGHLTDFKMKDLFKITEESMSELGHFQKMLIDPPRDGALEVVRSLGGNSPERIVYVSCNPATLARDADVLVHTKNYRLTAAGVVNMFPHTAHIESIAVFDKN